MKRKNIKYVTILLTTLLMISCGSQVKPRTLYWSGTSMIRQNDSLSNYSLYIGYYIEISDTGDANLMTRKMFQDTMLFYKIVLSESTKDRILKLAMDKSSCIEEKKDSDKWYIYDGFTYNLRIKSDTTDRNISFIRPRGNRVQKELVLVMDSIWTQHKIKAKTFFDLTEYRKNTEKEFFKNNAPPPLLKSTVKFVAPVIRNK
jgi:hypothetical protein